MITKENYGMEHIEKIREKHKVDRTILERSIYALGLLEALVTVGLPFVFKGGTSLTLLLKHPKRLSTDIDIVVEPGTNVGQYIEEASKIFPFKSVEQKVRIGRYNIEKRHYQFLYDSPAFGKEFYILLDVLYEYNNYARLIKKPIDNMLIITKEPYEKVTMPTVDCIMGDKLTAFAPHTTGVPLGIDKELEIIKQMYDVSCLFDEFNNYEDVYNSYMSTVKAEISYRGGNFSIEDVLWDTIDSAASIASRGTIGEDYNLFLSGIKKIATHIFDGKFNAEIAILKACKVMYIAACILHNVPIQKISNVDEYHNANISKSKYKKLGKIRNLEPEGFAYVVKAVEILNV